MISARPLLGFGWDRFQSDSGPYFRQSLNYPLTATNIDIHNYFLSYAVELGLIGLLLWLTGLLMGGFGALATRAPPELEPWRMAFLALAVCFLLVANATRQSGVATTSIYRSHRSDSDGLQSGGFGLQRLSSAQSLRPAGPLACAREAGGPNLHWGSTYVSPLASDRKAPPSADIGLTGIQICGRKSACDCKCPTRERTSLHAQAHPEVGRWPSGGAPLSPLRPLTNGNRHGAPTRPRRTTSPTSGRTCGLSSRQGANPSPPRCASAQGSRSSYPCCVSGPTGA